MSALSEFVDEVYEELSPAIIIAQLAQVVERQLEAARGLDARTLTAATAERQDLLFHLRLATQEARSRGTGQRIALDPESQLNLRRISALDKRLEVVLESVTSCLGTVLNRGAVDTYRGNGRMKG